MANYATLKAAIQNVVKTNGNNEITGALLQQSLLAMIDSLGSEYLFAGIAQPATTPGTPDQNVFYIAGPGTYSNFNSFVVPDGYLGIMKYNGSWSNETLLVGKNYDETIRLLAAHIYGDSIDYTRLATGGPLDLTPPILPGYTLVSITGANIGLVLLYDENGTTKTVSLPYVADKKYTRWAVYASGSPEITLHTQISGLEPRVQQIENIVETKIFIYKNGQTPDYENDIAEVYIVDLPAGNVTLKSYGNAAYLYTKSSGIFCQISGVPSENGKIYPVRVTSTTDPTNYPMQKIVGYVIFKDVSHFMANQTSTSEPEINRDRAENIHYSPNVQLQLYGQNVGEQLDALNSDVDALQGAIASITKEQNFTIANFVEGYTSTNSKNIGDSFAPVSSTTPVSSTSVAGQLVIPVNKGDNVTVKMQSTSNSYCMAYVFLDENYKILSWAGKTSQTFDWRTNPHTFNVENTGYLVLQFPKSNYNNNVNAPLSVVRSYIDISGGGGDETVEIALPSQINAIVGDTLQLYYRSIFRCVDFTKYDINVQCAIGAQYPRYYELTPLASQIGSYTLTFRVKDNNNKVIATKNTTLVVRAAGTSPAQNINVLCIGASGTNGGEWASELKRRLTGSGGTPAGSGLSNITFVGRKSVTKNGITVNLEATGGYRFSSYTNANTLSYRFNVANEPEINVGDVYAIGGHNYTITEINITTGQGGYFSCTGSGTPPASGTLTKVSGDGQDSVAYTSTSTSGNPFAYNGVVNVQQYATDYCNGQIDVIYTELFGNGSSAYANDDQVNARMQEMQTFITQFRTAFPNVKFCIGLMWNPDVRGGMGVNYGAAGGWSYAYGMKFTFMNYCNALQKYIDDNNLGDYVFICNWLNEFDEYNDFRQRQKPVNVRSSVTEIFGENGVHPSDVGYNQLADAAYRIFISKFCQ